MVSNSSNAGTGSMVEFPSNGTTASGYFAAATDGSGPGVIVIQEWWGLVPHIRDVVDRFAAAGFSALAPDLYRGTTTTEPDEAGKLMMALNLHQAAKDMSGAIAFLQGSDAVTSDGVGVIGFCMGGGLAMMLAAQQPDDVVACAPFYGLIPWEAAEPDWSRLAAPVRGHFAEHDGFFGPDKARGWRPSCRDSARTRRCASTPMSTTPSSTTIAPRCTPPRLPPLHGTTRSSSSAAPSGSGAQRRRCTSCSSPTTCRRASAGSSTTSTNSPGVSSPPVTGSRCTDRHLRAGRTGIRDAPFAVIRESTSTLLPTPQVLRHVLRIIEHRRPDVVVFGATFPLGLMGPAITPPDGGALRGLHPRTRGVRGACPGRRRGCCAASVVTLPR